MAATEKAQVEFTREKETPGTVRFKEDGEPESHVIGTLYVKKASKLSGKKTITANLEGKD